MPRIYIILLLIGYYNNSAISTNLSPIHTTSGGNDRTLSASWPGPKRPMLAVRKRRAANTVPSFHQMQEVGTGDQKAVEEGREGLRVGWSARLDTPSVQRRTSDAGDFGVPGEHQGGEDAGPDPYGGKSGLG